MLIVINESICRWETSAFSDHFKIPQCEPSDAISSTYLVLSTYVCGVMQLRQVYTEKEMKKIGILRFHLRLKLAPYLLLSIKYIEPLNFL